MSESAQKAKAKPELAKEMLRKLQNEMQGGVQHIIQRYAEAGKQMTGDEFQMILAGCAAGLHAMAGYECGLAYRWGRAKAGNPMTKGEEVQLEITDDHLLWASYMSAAALMISGAVQANREMPFPHPVIGAARLWERTGNALPDWAFARVEAAEKYEEILRAAEAMGAGQTQGNA